MTSAPSHPAAPAKGARTPTPVVAAFEIVWRPMESAPNGVTILVARAQRKLRYVGLVTAEDNDYNWSLFDHEMHADGFDCAYAWAYPPAAPQLSKLVKRRAKTGDR